MKKVPSLQSGYVTDDLCNLLMVQFHNYDSYEYIYIQFRN